MGSGSSTPQHSQYELSHSLDEAEEETSSRRHARQSFVLEKVDIPAHLVAESGQIRHDLVQPSVLDIPSLTRYPYVDYRFVKKIGNGRFSTVYKAVNLQDSQIKVAIKEVRIKDMLRSEYQEFKYELNVLSQLHHPSIVRMAAVYNPSPSNVLESSHKVYTVTEYLRGGELLAAIGQRTEYYEQDIRKMMQQFLSALAYLQKRGVQHRRLMPENLILSHPSFKKATLKIVDFGHAEATVSKRNINTNALDSYFTAPELYNSKEKSTHAVDVWSFGVVLSVALTGKSPLEGEENVPYLHPVHSFEHDEDWETVSPSARDLICQVLVANPLLRPKADDLLHHAWFKENTILPADMTTPRGVPLQHFTNHFKNKPNNNNNNNNNNPSSGNNHKVLTIDPNLEISLHDLKRNLPQIRNFREQRLVRHSLLVSSGVVTFLKVDRYANEKNYARLSDCSTLSGTTSRGEDSDEDDFDSDEEEESKRNQVDAVMKTTMLPSRSARMKFES